MLITLERREFSVSSTIGAMYVNGLFQCYTLEDIDRKLEESPSAKVQGKTAIPRGKYLVAITYSNRFRTELPLLQSVPGYEGVRIHAGNTPEDTEGCILVGTGFGADRIFNSRVALDALLRKMEVAYSKGEQITIEVK
jgi:hypothetical protein